MYYCEPIWLRYRYVICILVDGLCDWFDVYLYMTVLSRMKFSKIFECCDDFVLYFKAETSNYFLHIHVDHCLGSSIEGAKTAHSWVFFQCLIECSLFDIFLITSFFLFKAMVCHTLYFRHKQMVYIWEISVSQCL